MNFANEEKRIIYKLSKGKNKTNSSYSPTRKEEKENRCLETLKKFVSKIKYRLELKKKILIECILEEQVRKNSQFEFSNPRFIRTSNYSTTANSNKESFDNPKCLIGSDFELMKTDQYVNFEIQEYEKENYSVINNNNIILDDNQNVKNKISIQKDSENEKSTNENNCMFNENVNPAKSVLKISKSSMISSSSINYNHSDKYPQKKELHEHRVSHSLRNLEKKLSDIRRNLKDEKKDISDLLFLSSPKSHRNTIDFKDKIMEKKNYQENYLIPQNKEFQDHWIKRRLSLFYNKIIFFLNFKKYILIKRLVALRESAALKLQTYLRMAKKRKQVLYILEKSRKCYLIKCKIKFANNVQLKVLMKDKSEKRLDFYLCPIRKTYVLYIEKKLVQEPKYYVNFIADGNTIIDPLYRTDYDKEGNFFNIIDFEKLEEEERERELERDYFYSQKGIDTLKLQNQGFLGENKISSGEKSKKKGSDNKDKKNRHKINKDSNGNLSAEFNSSKDDSCIDYSSENNGNRSQNQSSSEDDLGEDNNNAHLNKTVGFKDRHEKDLDSNCVLNTSVEDFENERMQKKSFGTDMNLTKIKKRNSVIYSDAYKKSSFNINKGGGIKHVFSTVNLKPQKSILKSPSSGCKASIPKRVSFGNVQISN